MFEGLVFIYIWVDNNIVFCIFSNFFLSVNIIFVLLFGVVVVGNNIVDFLKELNDLIL